MKALFVLHEGIFIYGANRSIAGVLQNLEYDFDLLICKSFTRKADEAELRRLLGPHLQRIFTVWMPRYRCQYYDRVSVFSECSHVVNNVMAFFSQGKRKRVIRQGGYDYVHLNSLVLFPVIDDQAGYIVHAREIIDPQYRRIRQFTGALEHAAGIIYIDEATRIPIEAVMRNRRAMVLNNPFDMMWVENVDYEKSLKECGVTRENTIFAMLGQVGDNKGSKFVLRAFMQHANPNSRLLIVGNNDHAYGRECAKMTENDKRVIYCGELKDTGGIYRISDYIIRGEPQFCIGRTIYEGLFAGAGVIIPGHAADIEKMQSGEELREKIHFYEPKNEASLASVIQKCSLSKQTDRVFQSNIRHYMEQYNRFIDKALKKKR
ncbi:MAG: glycosyltransferase [Bacteroidales bacterium]|nr:glycosyltransferase [Bacteroidales bacterium]MCM1414539.1 glycosyltransferase [bacterium]MCM1422589.1 glycosyltransferase [bacterium]